MKHHLFKWFGFFTLIGCSLLIHQAWSLSIARADLEELTTESAKIVLGHVTAIDYQWQDQSRKTIETKLTISVEQYIKGSGGSTITVTQLGGTMGDLTMEISGTPQFDVGDEVLFFLLEHQGKYWIHSIALGAFSVVTKNNGEKLVINHLQGVEIIDRQTGARVAAENAFPIVSLNDFISQITDYIR